MNLEWIHNLSPQVATFLLAMIPVGESRVAIPVALETLHLSIWQSFSLAVIGSFLPGVLIIYFIEPISKVLRKVKVLDRFFVWLFTRTRRNFEKKYAVWGNLALMFFVAVPLPGTGVWTGSLAAWLFGIKRKDSLLYIFLGALLAGILITLLSLGFFKLII